MRLKTHQVALLGGLAALVAGNGQAVADQQQTTIALTAIPSGVYTTATGMMAGFRTSDPGASFVTCTLSGNNLSCSQGNMNNSQKNLGNILCLPDPYLSYQVGSATCQGLLGQPPGGSSCQQNSSSGKCPSGMTPVMPYCNYRTSPNMSTVASWSWTVTLPASTGGTTTVDCSNSGYSGVSP